MKTHLRLCPVCYARWPEELRTVKYYSDDEMICDLCGGEAWLISVRRRPLDVLIQEVELWNNLDTLDSGQSGDTARSPG